MGLPPLHPESLLFAPSLDSGQLASAHLVPTSGHRQGVGVVNPPSCPPHRLVRSFRTFDLSIRSDLLDGVLRWHRLIAPVQGSARYAAPHARRSRCVAERVASCRFWRSRRCRDCPRTEATRNRPSEDAEAVRAFSCHCHFADVVFLRDLIQRHEHEGFPNVLFQFL